MLVVGERQPDHRVVLSGCERNNGFLRTGLPHGDRVAFVGGGQPFAVRGEGGDQRVVLARFVGAQLLARGHVVEADEADFRQGDGEERAVRRQGKAAHGPPRGDDAPLPPGPSVPDVDVAVVVHSQPPAVRGQGGFATGLQGQAIQEPTLRRPDRHVHRGGDHQDRAVRPEENGRHGALVNAEFAVALAGRGVPQANGAVGAGGGQRLAVRGKGQAQDLLVVPEARRAETGDGAGRQRVAEPVRARRLSGGGADEQDGEDHNSAAKGREHGKNLLRPRGRPVTLSGRCPRGGSSC